MRIAFFLPSLEGGGAERVTLNLAGGIAARGHAVDLLLAARTGPFLADVPPAVRVVDLGAGRVVRALTPLTHWLRRERPDHLVSALDHANLVALWAVARAGTRTPVTCVVHTTMSRTISNPGAWTDRVLLPPLIRRFYGRAHAVVAVSDGAGEDLRAFLGSRVGRVEVIANPVVLPDLAERATAPAPHPWFDDVRVPVLLGVGRLWHQKDFATLLRAFAAAGLQDRARLVILGEGVLRPDLEALRTELGLADAVAMPGFAPSPYPAMRRSAGFVLSSVFEALPTVLIEALALGTPVVATDCPTGPREILDGGRWGRLVPVGDVAALADAMRALVDEAGTRRPVPASVLAPYTLDTAVDRYLALLGAPAMARQ
ncbi:MAG: glycosyltransferase [Gemmatimonadaceae bacterium]|nr:glycosyltransferase [Gemmatimonadaceae bacterium]